MNKFTARELLKGRVRAGSGKSRRNSRRSARQSIKNQLRDFEKLSNLDQFEDADLETKDDHWRKWPCRSLASLQNFLTSNIGKPWDEVYSEACQAFDSRSFAGYNARKELLDQVVFDLEMYKARHTRNNYYLSDIFFVDEEGHLRYIPRSVTAAEPEYPSDDELKEFLRAEKRHSAWWPYGKIWHFTRRIIQRGRHLYWAYNNGCDIFTQREELSKDEVEFFNRLSRYQKKSVMYEKVKSSGLKYPF